MVKKSYGPVDVTATWYRWKRSGVFQELKVIKETTKTLLCLSERLFSPSFYTVRYDKAETNMYSPCFEDIKEAIEWRRARLEEKIKKAKEAVDSLSVEYIEFCCDYTKTE